MDGPGVARRLLDARAVTPAFQPLIDLDTRQVLGYEALARGSDEQLPSDPGSMFAAAREEQLLPEFDWLCREQAVEAARSARMRHPLSLFVNAEPEALSATAADAERWRSFNDLRCYTEVTERALLHRPGQLLRALEQIREQDWGIALDDIGANEDTLALMPLVRPDVLKLDLSLLTSRADLRSVRALHAVLAQAAETGASVVAEGIETEEQLDSALGYGIRLGQGYLLGRPGPLPQSFAFPSLSLPLVTRVVDRSMAPAPFAVVNSKERSREVTARALLEMARQLLVQADGLQPRPVVLAAVPTAPLLTVALTTRLGHLANRLPLVGLLTPEGLPEVEGVRRSPLEAADPATADFDLAVVSPFFAASLVARPSGVVPGCWDTVLSFRRDVAVGAANALLARMRPAPETVLG